MRHQGPPTWDRRRRAAAARPPAERPPHCETLERRLLLSADPAQGVYGPAEPSDGDETPLEALIAGAPSDGEAIALEDVLATLDEATAQVVLVVNLSDGRAMVRVDGDVHTLAVSIGNPAAFSAGPQTPQADGAADDAPEVYVDGTTLVAGSDAVMRTSSWSCGAEGGIVNAIAVAAETPGDEAPAVPRAVHCMAAAEGDDVGQDEPSGASEDAVVAAAPVAAASPAAPVSEPAAPAGAAAVEKPTRERAAAVSAEPVDAFQLTVPLSVSRALRAPARAGGPRRAADMTLGEILAVLNDRPAAVQADPGPAAHEVLQAATRRRRLRSADAAAVRPPAVAPAAPATRSSACDGIEDGRKAADGTVVDVLVLAALLQGVRDRAATLAFAAGGAVAAMEAMKPLRILERDVPSVATAAHTLPSERPAAWV